MKFAMRFILPVLFFVSLAASVLVYFAAGMLHTRWARGVCAVIGRGCADPWIIYAGASLLLALNLLQRGFRDRS